MKKTKRILSAFLVFVMAFTMLCGATPATEVMAKTSAKSVTLIQGEVMKASNYYKVKSASSSKKSVATVKKDKDNNKYVLITAKKAGTATITVKTTRGTYKYKVKVVKPDFSIKVNKVDEDYVYYSVKNNTSVFIDTLYVNCVFKNSEGEVVDTNKSFYVEDLCPGDTAYRKMAYYGYTVDKELSSGKYDPEKTYRSLDYKYTSRKGKVDVSFNLNEETGKYAIKYKSSYGDNMNVAVDILLYDADDNLVDIINDYAYLKSKAVFTSERSVFNEFDHYKIVKRAFSKKHVA